MEPFRCRGDAFQTPHVRLSVLHFLSTLMLIFSPPHFIIPPPLISCGPSQTPLVFQSPPVSLPIPPPSSSISFPVQLHHLLPLLTRRCPPTPRPPPPFPLLHSRHSELFSMSSFIAGARSQLQLITERRAGGTRSAFRSALSLHFAINPFHTPPRPPATTHLPTRTPWLTPFLLPCFYSHLSTSASPPLPLSSPLKSLLQLCLTVQRL